MGSIGAVGTTVLDEDKGEVLSTALIEGLTDRTKYMQPTLERSKKCQKKEQENAKTANILDEEQQRKNLVKEISIIGG
jgi:phosphoribosylaminoimidazole-succinocarboxamide synthase